MAINGLGAVVHDHFGVRAVVVVHQGMARREDRGVQLAGYGRVACIGMQVQDTAVVFHGDLGFRHMRLLVDILEVHRVTGILRDVLYMGRHIKLGKLRRGPVRIVKLRDVGQLPLWRYVLGVVPDPDLPVLLFRVPGADAGALGNLIAVGDFLAHAVGAKTPAVEGATYRFTHHAPLDAEVRAKVWAERILQYHRAGTGAIQGKFTIEGGDVGDVADLQFVAAPDGIPAHGEIRGCVGA